MRFGRRRRRSTLKSSRRRRSNFLPRAVLLGVVGFFLWAGWQFFSAIFDTVRSESASAEITILKGRVEAKLSGTDKWGVTFSEQKFFSGDQVRTGANTRASLDLFGANTLFLGPDTLLEIQTLEQKSSGKRIALLKLNQGQLWAKVSDDDFSQESGSRFEITTPRSRVLVRGTVLNVTAGAAQDTVRLIKGGVEVEVLKEGEKPKTVVVGVGQKFTITPETYAQVAKGVEPLEILDQEFIESEWHLKNLEQFFPDEATQIRRRIEVSKPRTPDTPPTEKETVLVEGGLQAPQITSPAAGTVIPTNAESVKIEGIAPEGAHQMVVNGFTLTRYQPGNRKWVYFAAPKFGTLLPGENTYTVYAVTRDGKQSPSAQVTVQFQGVDKGISAGVKAEKSREAQLNSIFDFAAPTIIKPEIAANGGKYQTSSEVVTISGTVDPKTNTVEINGFRLKKFKPGNTEFTYFASAEGGNMKVGENVYEVVAFGPDGKRATTTLTVVYTPINLGQ